jgi:hypothetical protein
MPLWKELHLAPRNQMVQVLCCVNDIAYSPVTTGDHAGGEYFVTIGWLDGGTGAWHLAGWSLHADVWTPCSDVEPRMYTELAPTPGGRNG